MNSLVNLQEIKKPSGKILRVWTKNQLRYENIFKVFHKKNSTEHCFSRIPEATGEVFAFCVFLFRRGFFFGGCPGGGRLGGGVPPPPHTCVKHCLPTPSRTSYNPHYGEYPATPHMPKHTLTRSGGRGGFFWTRPKACRGVAAWGVPGRPEAGEIFKNFNLKINEKFQF